MTVVYSHLRAVFFFSAGYVPVCLSKEVDPPFSLCVPHPRLVLVCSEDPVTPYKDLLIVVEVDTLISPCYDLSVLRMFADTNVSYSFSVIGVCRIPILNCYL